MPPAENLNREWVNPAMESAPEVFLAKQAMAATGVDFFMDVHGDESLPYCFIAGTEGLAGWVTRIKHSSIITGRIWLR